MTPIETIETLEFVFSIGLLLWLFYGPWQRFILDGTRQVLFEIRDSVFDLAADGELSFESEVYQSIRDMLNKMIKYASFSSWTHILAFRLSRPEKLGTSPDVLGKINALENRDLAAKLRKRYMTAIAFLIMFLILRSSILIALFMLLLPVILVNLLLSRSDPLPELRKAVEADINISAVTT